MVRSPGGGDQARDLEIRVPGRRGADADIIIGEPDMERLAVGLRVDGDRLDTQLLASANDADRDFAAVGDQDLLEHSAIGV